MHGTWRTKFKERQGDKIGALKRWEEEQKHALNFLRKFGWNRELAVEKARSISDRSPEGSFERSRYNAIAEIIKNGGPV